MAQCPSCGEPVTQFAAGCAICGADLEAERRKPPPIYARVDVGGPVRALNRRVDDGVKWVAICVLVVSVVPLFGALLAFFGMNASEVDSRPPLRRAMVAIIAVGAVCSIVPQTRIGLLGLL